MLRKIYIKSCKINKFLPILKHLISKTYQHFSLMTVIRKKYKQMLDIINDFKSNDGSGLKISRY